VDPSALKHVSRTGELFSWLTGGCGKLEAIHAYSHTLRLGIRPHLTSLLLDFPAANSAVPIARDENVRGGTPGQRADAIVSCISNVAIVGGEHGLLTGNERHDALSGWIYVEPKRQLALISPAIIGDSIWLLVFSLLSNALAVGLHFAHPSFRAIEELRKKQSARRETVDTRQSKPGASQTRMEGCRQGWNRLRLGKEPTYEEEYIPKVTYMDWSLGKERISLAFYHHRTTRVTL